MGTLKQVETTGLAQIAQIGLIDTGLMEHVRSEVLTAELPWTEAYGTYQSGGWHTVSLYNASAKADDVVIRDCSAVPTDVLSAMPNLRNLIDGLGLDIMWARLARQSANSFLFEHVDYAELDETNRHRIHLPITTNASCRFAFGGKSANLTGDRIWRLAPVLPHGSCNQFGPDRIHLIIDCYENQSLRDMMAEERPIDDEALDLPRLTPHLACIMMKKAWLVLQLGFQDAAERILLRLFFEFRMEPGEGYDAVARLHEMAGDATAARHWRSKKSMMMGRMT